MSEHNFFRLVAPGEPAPGGPAALSGAEPTAFVIRTAVNADLNRAMEFYAKLVSELQPADRPPWRPGVYPSDDDILSAIENRELTLGWHENEIAAAMIINQSRGADYDKVGWLVQAHPEDIVYVHLLGVRPRFAGRGLARLLLAEAASYGKASGRKAIRLDTLARLPKPQKLYERAGFHKIKTMRMSYRSSGETDFVFYERPL